MLSTSRSSRLALLVAALAVAAPAVAACAPAASEASMTDDIGVVLAPTMGGSALAPADLDVALDLLDEEGDHLIAVVADGEPSVVVDITLPELPGNGKEREAWLAQFRSDARTALLEKRASEPEVDLTEAIALTASAFRADTRRTLVVYSSGLSTAGALSMLDGRLYAEPSDLVAHAAQSGIPRLDAVSVRMPTLGVVTDPQPALSTSARQALVDIWTTYFRTAQATDVRLESTSLLARPFDGEALPLVTPVAVERPQPLAAADCRQLLGDASVGFAAGSAELVDPDAARALVAGVVDRLSACPGVYRVEGSASSEGLADTNQALSADRAHAVAALLAAESGTPLSEMNVTGWGTTWPCRVPDMDAAGALILSAAIANRTVVVSKGEPSASPSC
ncbi:OmpA family protein [Microbacterium sp. SLBN-146]|uniref:OmpA family protein n=1 Tax=Microbacterium sp. SLBN-146 TaxID=2768457 RepID=UPI00116AA2AF|nr:OmpA family protein [Microbacterium sp. SLBN-146]TQJ30693.1 OmpA family protein [Microbacterium sp. SLBN-146]